MSPEAKAKKLLKALEDLYNAVGSELLCENPDNASESYPDIVRAYNKAIKLIAKLK